MNNETLERQISLTPDVVKSKLQIALTKAEQSVQALHDAESSLVYNEDNLGVIKLFIENCKTAKATVEKERIRLKEPSLQESRNIDAGAKLITVDIDALVVKANLPYQKLCQEVERKQRESALEAQRVANIRGQMNNFKIEYSVKISDAKTSKELIDIERRINLETGNSSRYQEFLPEMKTLCEPIRALLTAQKNKVRELEELEITAKEAAETGNDEVFLEVQDKKEALEANVAQNRLSIQEEALKQATEPTESATIILPLIPKGGRKLWRYELVDEKAATKAGLTKVVICEEKVTARLKEIRENETEVIENGIRYYVENRF